MRTSEAYTLSLPPSKLALPFACRGWKVRCLKPGEPVKPQPPRRLGDPCERFRARIWVLGFRAIGYRAIRFLGSEFGLSGHRVIGKL